MSIDVVTIDPASPRRSARMHLVLAVAVAIVAWQALAPVAQAQHDAATTADASLGEARLPGDVAALLAAVTDHPALVAARQALDAAQADVDAVRFPLALEGEAGAQRFDVTAEPAAGVPQSRVDEAVDELRWNLSASIRARLRPFRIGDLGDLEAQRVVALRRAERRVSETRAALETGALQAAAGLLVAERGVDLAEAGRQLAQAAVETTRLRLDRGAAREDDVRRAELELARAEERVRAARAGVARASARLADLVGPGRRLEELPDPTQFPRIPEALALDPAVATARDDVALARIGVGSAERGLFPTAQVSYAWTTDDGAISVSLESRTFQPTLGYETPDPYANLTQGLDPTGALLAEPATIDGVLTVGLSFAIGPESAYGVSAAEARLRAAEAGLAAARLDAERAADDRDEAVRAARAELAFTRTDAELAGSAADDVRRQVDLGVATPLEALRADLSSLDATLTVLNARVALLSALLDDYRALAVPLSEVRP